MDENRDKIYILESEITDEKSENEEISKIIVYNVPNLTKENEE